MVFVQLFSISKVCTHQYPAVALCSFYCMYSTILPQFCTLYKYKYMNPLQQTIYISTINSLSFYSVNTQVYSRSYFLSPSFASVSFYILTVMFKVRGEDACLFSHACTRTFV